MLSRDDVVAHADFLPSAWKPVVQGVTNRPYGDDLLAVDITMYGLGETVYDWPVITISDTSRGGIAWRDRVAARHRACVRRAGRCVRARVGGRLRDHGAVRRDPGTSRAGGGGVGRT